MLQAQGSPPCSSALRHPSLPGLESPSPQLSVGILKSSMWTEREERQVSTTTPPPPPWSNWTCLLCWDRTFTASPDLRIKQG